MNTPTISVILPCYNAHAYLPRALESLRAQSFQGFETLIINDGSTDPDTLAYLESLSDDIQVIHQENRGLAAARNRGFKEARAELVLPLDCDDWLATAFLEEAYNVLESNPKKSFVFADLALEGESEGILEKPFNLFEQLYFNQLPYCMLMPRSAWESIGGYDEAMRLGYEDWEFNIRLGLNGYRGVPLGKPYFHYWVSSSGMLASISRTRHISLWRYIRVKHEEAYRPGRLWARWREWRRRPSVRPLFAYLVWDSAYRILPDPVLLGIFWMLRPFSHSARENRRAARG
jgi:glycosyltransferase involved in cell wall biosynthesis